MELLTLDELALLIFHIAFEKDLDDCLETQLQSELYSSNFHNIVEKNTIIKYSIKC